MAMFREFMSAKELQKKLEEQQRQIQLYERKLRDVVKAYKGLEAEKNALQSVVSAMDATDNAAPDAQNSIGEKSATSTTPVLSASDTPSDKVAQLQQALSTLTREKAKREAAFQSDKKALLAENEQLKEQLARTAEDTEKQADKLEKVITNLNEKVRRIEGDRERELSDHGHILAEMQQRFAAERKKNDELTKQISEAYKQLHSKESQPVLLEQKALELQRKIKETNKELEEWKEKAQHTPSVRILQDQIANMKMEHAKEMAELMKKTGQEVNTEREQRLQILEDRIHEMTSRVAEAEEERREAEERAIQLEAKLRELEFAPVHKSVHTDAEKELKRLTADFLLRFPDANIDEVLGIRTQMTEFKLKYEELATQFEDYKQKTNLRHMEDLRLSRESRDEDDVATSSLKSVVAQLHERLKTANGERDAEKAVHEKVITDLKEKIADLEKTVELARLEAQSNIQKKIAEIEAEMQKQRVRTLEVLEEREHELEVTRSILVSVRSEQMSKDPVDPPQKVSAGKRRSSDFKRYADRRKSSSGHSENASPTRPISIPNPNESRNIFYEEELQKKDKEIIELRQSVQQLDFRMREIEQNYLTKDLQHYEMVEKLKEEIRVLEGKLRLLGSDGNMEYLRNIFVQYLHCDSAQGKKHILKAIATVLKLSANEMKPIGK